jgi:hypothetical protein
MAIKAYPCSAYNSTAATSDRTEYMDLQSLLESVWQQQEK